MHLRAALAAGHDDVEIHHHLAFLARGRDDLDEAADRYSDALEHDPADARLHNNLAEARRAQGRFAESVALYRRALALDPDSAAIAANLGAVLLAIKRPDLALPVLEQAAERDPRELRAFSDLAICLCSLNRYKDALPVYRHIYETQPNANDARYLEALALLALGDFENGWRKHEVRWFCHLGQAMRRPRSGPQWLGEDDLTGRTILVHAEQGYGDTVQYLRFIPRLRECAGRVILEVQPLLKPLLADQPDVFGRGEELPDHDVQCSFMSLPRAFRLTPDTIPATVPYLSVAPERIAAWRDRLGQADGRQRVGIAWTGTSTTWNRSIPLPLLAPLLRRKDCEFHIIQTEMEPGDRATLDGMPHLIDHSRELTDFADTAALVTLMDRIITVDTVLAHLGGALAKPTWTMLPFGAEYRWRTSGQDSAWYPTMRLFRQPALLAWPLVVDAINDALSA